MFRVVRRREPSLPRVTAVSKGLTNNIASICFQIRDMLKDIETLESAYHTANGRLKEMRDATRSGTQAEALLEGHIEEINKEKRLITTNLPTLIRYHLLTRLESYTSIRHLRVCKFVFESVFWHIATVSTPVNQLGRVAHNIT